MSIPVLPGISAQTIQTARLTTRVLFSGPEEGIPVLFLHGNTSNATWWEETMLALPIGFRGIAPDQRGFGEADFAIKIDATRGMRDLADDAIALMDTLNISQVHVVGNSLGGSVAWQLMIDAIHRLRSVVQVAPGSPFGFGGTKDLEGTPCYPDYAGSGGGLANPELLQRIQVGDRSLDSQFSPRAALRSLIIKPPLILPREEEILSGMLSMHVGAQDNPGGYEKSPNWPFVAPGIWGPANALSPKYVGDISYLYKKQVKPHVLWIRGANDLLVSDSAASDPAVLGMMGLLPGWPGTDIYPPQPMLAQTRAVLDQYAKTGGSYREEILPESAHAPFLEKPGEFNKVFHLHLLQQESR
jgi:pimeloyl-ACP methyl ester carboxylesterase